MFRKYENVIEPRKNRYSIPCIQSVYIFCDANAYKRDNDKKYERYRSLKFVWYIQTSTFIAVWSLFCFRLLNTFSHELNAYFRRKKKSNNTLFVLQ